MGRGKPKAGGVKTDNGGRPVTDAGGRLVFNAGTDAAPVHVLDNAGTPAVEPLSDTAGPGAGDTA